MSGLYQRLEPLQAVVSTLRHSHRFSAASRVGQIATAIRAGDADTAIDLLRSAAAEPGSGIVWLSSNDPEAVAAETVRRVVADSREWLTALRRTPAGTADILSQVNRTRVLCAHRNGPLGDLALNRRIIERLGAEQLLRPRTGQYPGRVVIVTRNDARQNLFNGDIGLVVRPPDRDGLAVLFDDPSAADRCRRVPAALVPEVQDCFAMTIHKSQGSEFPRVLTVLPGFDSPVLTRELLYTAVTRLRETPALSGANPVESHSLLLIAAPEEVLRTAIARQVRRASGICDAISAALHSGR